MKTVFKILEVSRLMGKILLAYTNMDFGNSTTVVYLECVESLVEINKDRLYDCFGVPNLLNWAFYHNGQFTALSHTQLHCKLNSMFNEQPCLHPSWINA
jgi:hypothetical protein